MLLSFQLALKLPYVFQKDFCEELLLIFWLGKVDSQFIVTTRKAFWRIKQFRFHYFIMRFFVNAHAKQVGEHCEKEWSCVGFWFA